MQRAIAFIAVLGLCLVISGTVQIWNHKTVSFQRAYDKNIMSWQQLQDGYDVVGSLQKPVLSQARRVCGVWYKSRLDFPAPSRGNLGVARKIAAGLGSWAQSSSGRESREGLALQTGV